ncbi:hypothetical protein EKO04_006652 [Ascochyta lentis]|uniref:PNPLA domain-containing protein n=1 Tax=Ascochyta lentis TaxID=205686 RepID=A0A8H7J215_9PLEO|nr:hypothetical protein EKO04_006652 [Ascochyta lentis]
MVYTPATKHPNGARLLALDGGGVRGIVALEMLNELMIRVQKRDGLKEVPRPADYFELAAGTSTGGIIGIMLFRLRMTVADTIIQYDKIGADVFSPKIYGWNIGKVLPVSVASFINNSKNVVQNSRFDDADLKKAIDEVVAKFGLDDNDRKLKGEAPLYHPGAGRAFCCTTAQNKCETVLLRSYETEFGDNKHYTQSVTNDIMRDHHPKVTISLATRATSAAPTFFPEVRFPNIDVLMEKDTSSTPAWKKKISATKKQLVFWDGGLLNNNPIDQLWYARYELVQPSDPAPPISCVISLGTGFVGAASPSDSMIHLAGVVGNVMDFSTNTNAKAKDFTRHMNRLKQRSEHTKSQYVRLQPNLGADKIGLAEYTRMEDLKKLTRVYLEKADSQKWIEKAVCAICCSGCDACRE